MDQFNVVPEKIVAEVVQTVDDRNEKPEVWVNTICGFCGSGCGVQVGLKQGKVIELKGRSDYPVNYGRLCVKGFYQLTALNSPQRATMPLVRKNGRLTPVTWQEALDVVAEKMSQLLSNWGPEALGIYNTGQLTLEEFYALGKLARGFLGTPNIDSSLRLCMSSASQALIRAFGSDGAPGCYEDLDLADCILIFGCNIAEMFPELWHRIQARQKKGARIVVADPRKTATARGADIHLQVKPGQNVPLLHALLHVLFRQGLVDARFVMQYTRGWEELRLAIEDYSPEQVAGRVGVPAAQIREAAMVFGEASRATSVFMQGVFQSAAATDAANLLLDLHLLTGNIGRPGASPLPLTGQANSAGSREAGGGSSFVGMRNAQNPVHRREVARVWGISEEVLPEKNRDIFEMLDAIEDGQLKLLWNIASNPAVSLPDISRVQELLTRVFLVVQDIYYPMETAQFADVFLPAAGWGEKTGVFTNSERRVSLLQQFQEPPGQAKRDLKIFQLVAQRLGFVKGFDWSGPEEVFAEWKELSAGRPCDMRGINYQRLKETTGLQWPCPAEDHPGTPRLYTSKKFSTAPEYSQIYGEFNDEQHRARICCAEDKPQAETPSAEYPFWLNTGRLLEHYHTRTKTKRVPELNRLMSRAFVEINPVDAADLQVKRGDKVKLVSPRGSIEVLAKPTDNVVRGQLFVPFHFGDLDPGENAVKQAANRLTQDNRDPISSQPLLKLSVCRLEKI